MDKLINRTKQFVFAKQSNILSSAVLLAFMIIASRIFGFLRYRILVSYFSSSELDIFFAAFRIPDLIFEILITGAFTSAFIPVFIKYQDNMESLSSNISNIINFIIGCLIILIIMLCFSLNWLIPLITPGFSLQQTRMLIYYSRILLLFQLPFLVLGSIVTGIGQANKTFFLSALAPVIYNLAIIVITYFFANHLFLMAPIIGVVIGAGLFLIVQIPLLSQSNFTYRFILKKTADLVEFLKMVVPRIITVIIAQIDATIDLTLTTLLGLGSYTVFYLAQHLQLLPVSVIGVAFGQASLPYLSEIYQAKKYEEFKKLIIDSILNLFFIAIPIASYFIFARTPLIRLFFGGQKFDWNATVLTALTLSAFALSLPFHIIYYFLTRCFYAFLDSKTPFFISLLSVLINTCLSLIFILIFHLPVWAIALAFSFSIIVNVILLLVILYKRLGGFNLQLLIFETIKILIATVCTSIVVYFLIKILDGLIFDTTRTINVFFLLVVSGTVYFLLYLFLAWVLEVKEIFLITKLLFKIKQLQKKTLEVATSYE
jgi:putative peptidoglycan lipid II flippase